MNKNKEIPQIVIDAKNRGRKIIKLSNRLGDFYFAKLTKPEVRRVISSAGNSREKFSALMKNQIKKSIIYPKVEEFETLLKNKPGLFAPMYSEILDKTGISEKFTVEAVSLTDEILPEMVKGHIENGIEVVKLFNEKETFYFEKLQSETIETTLDTMTKDKKEYVTFVESNIMKNIIISDKENFAKITEDRPGLPFALFNELMAETGLTDSFLAEEI
ncbi:MAG: hypothetical protein A2086_03365 [Spirochaetes bacterium GWD1_27_9]|nr:MAG: hypothetical protein A2Z98_12595 [Spirochaetes bacterium GWB1_27_13]OHD45288.1 MAG: hypothetical protein A2086_03365 [Spirochaetes bacterium GWD1_27_9]